MGPRCLLVDLGASRVKSARCDAETGELSGVRSAPSLAGSGSRPGRFEVDPAALRERFETLCELHWREAPNGFDAVFLSSEMHGFVAVDGRGAAVSPYVSWRDQRALETHAGVSTAALIGSTLGSRFRDITGMRFRPGIAFGNVLHLARSGALPSSIVLHSLPDWLAGVSGEGPARIHESMAGSLGLLDVSTRAASPELIEVLHTLGGVRCALPEVSASPTPAGWWRRDGRRVPIYTGVGDQSCAILGSGNRVGETLSVNVGTGSQVSTIVRSPEGVHDFDVRVHLDGTWLRTITHIPAGRALNVYMGFLAEVARAAGAVSPDPWPWLSELGLEDLECASLAVDLAVFESAWRFRRGGSISGFVEGELTVRNVLASIVRALAQQYADAAAIVDPSRQLGEVVLSGGVPARMPVLAPWLARTLGRPVRAGDATDETLLGLSLIARQALGRHDA
jgi:sugar (pentulose or hexulose) kinase